MNVYLKNILISIVFYSIISGLAAGLEALAPSGPCTPGGGILFIILVAPILTLGFITYSIIKITKGHKEHLIALISSIVAIVTLVLLA